MAQGQQAQAPAHAVDERNLHRKMIRRILPFPSVCYVVSYLDRVNLGFTALCVAVASINACVATFWAVPSSFLTGRAAAGGIAMIVSIGNLGGFAGPYMIGFVRDLSGGFTAPLLAIGCTLLFGATLMIVFGRLVRRDAVPAAVAA